MRGLQDGRRKKYSLVSKRLFFKHMVGLNMCRKCLLFVQISENFVLCLKSGHLCLDFRDLVSSNQTHKMLSSNFRHLLQNISMRTSKKVAYVCTFDMPFGVIISH